MLRAPFPLHTCHRQYPGAAIAGTTLLFSRNDLSLPRIDWQVGPHITLFEACSAFTHVAACILAKSPSDPLHRRLQPLRYLHDCSGCFRREQKSPGGIRTRRKGATFSWRTSNSRGQHEAAAFLIGHQRHDLGRRLHGNVSKHAMLGSRKPGCRCPGRALGLGALGKVVQCPRRASAPGLIY